MKKPKKKKNENSRKTSVISSLLPEHKNIDSFRKRHPMEGRDV